MITADESRRNAIEEGMAQLLSSIEKDRDALGALAKELNKLKSDLKKTEEDLTEQVLQW